MSNALRLALLIAVPWTASCGSSSSGAGGRVAATDGQAHPTEGGATSGSSSRSSSGSTSRAGSGVDAGTDSPVPVDGDVAGPDSDLPGPDASAATPPDATAGAGDATTPEAGGARSDASDAAPPGYAPDGSAPDGSSTTGHRGPWRIMPLGDSITGTTCYPQLLSKELLAKNHGNFNFIGTNLNNQSCGPGAPSLMTEGHGGYLVTFLTTDTPSTSGKGTLSQLKTWAAEKPDVVLMQFGTNDVWNNLSTASILSAYDFVVDQFRSQNPLVIFFVAQILPMHPAGCAGCEAGVEALNGQIPGWATGKTMATSPIHVVNVWSSVQASAYLPGSADTSDGVHPNVVGAQAVADTWYSGITSQGLP